MQHSPKFLPSSLSREAWLPPQLPARTHTHPPTTTHMPWLAWAFFAATWLGFLGDVIGGRSARLGRLVKCAVVAMRASGLLAPVPGLSRANSPCASPTTAQLVRAPCCVHGRCSACVLGARHTACAWYAAWRISLLCRMRCEARGRSVSLSQSLAIPCYVLERAADPYAGAATMLCMLPKSMLRRLYSMSRMCFHESERFMAGHICSSLRPPAFSGRPIPLSMTRTALVLVTLRAHGHASSPAGAHLAGLPVGKFFTNSAISC